jgi:hypothetical protein
MASPRLPLSAIVRIAHISVETYHQLLALPRFARFTLNADMQQHWQTYYTNCITNIYGQTAWFIGHRPFTLKCRYARPRPIHHNRQKEAHELHH